MKINLFIVTILVAGFATAADSSFASGFLHTVKDMQNLMSSTTADDCFASTDISIANIKNINLPPCVPVIVKDASKNVYRCSEIECIEFPTESRIVISTKVNKNGKVTKNVIENFERVRLLNKESLVRIVYKSGAEYRGIVNKKFERKFGIIECGNLSYRGRFVGGNPFGMGVAKMQNEAGMEIDLGEFRNGNPHGVCLQLLVFPEIILGNLGFFCFGRLSGEGIRVEISRDGLVSWDKAIYRNNGAELILGDEENIYTSDLTEGILSIPFKNITYNISYICSDKPEKDTIVFHAKHENGTECRTSCFAPEPHLEKSFINPNRPFTPSPLRLRENAEDVEDVGGRTIDEQEQCIGGKDVFSTLSPSVFNEESISNTLSPSVSNEESSIPKTESINVSET
jgi:hypothetical protein